MNIEVNAKLQNLTERKTNFVFLATIIVMMQSICNIFSKPNIYF